MDSADSNILIPTARNGVVGRYAPSPTGDLHLGNLRTALVAWQAVRECGGTFILRIEDIDGPRTVAGSEARIIDDLRWLGIDWDEGPDVGGPAGPYRQSERTEIYEAALARLAAAGRTYLCTCSRRELRGGEGEASAPHGNEGPPYAGTCRQKDPAAQRAHRLGAATRLRIEESEARVVFEDIGRGRQEFDLEKLCGDFIVRRRDGLWAYQLACAVDDALMGVTEVVRGEDLLGSTPRQIAVMRALGLREPAWRHIPLVADEKGERMSKRDGSLSLGAMRARGLAPAEAREIIMGTPLV